jgi:hypothetical protein
MRSSLTSSIFIALAITVGCQPLPRAPRGGDVTLLPSAGLTELQPNDIAIPPIEVASKSIQAPDLTIRTAFQRALVQRRYAPLSLESVDRRVVDASYQPGNLREDAVLQIIVHRWDESHWESSRDIFADIEVRLIDAAHPEKAPLWGGRLEQKLRGYPYETQVTNRQTLIQVLCDDYASEVLGALPTRSTSPEAP